MEWTLAHCIPNDFNPSSGSPSNFGRNDVWGQIFYSTNIKNIDYIPLETWNCLSFHTYRISRWSSWFVLPHVVVIHLWMTAQCHRFLNFTLLILRISTIQHWENEIAYLSIPTESPYYLLILFCIFQNSWLLSWRQLTFTYEIMYNYIIILFCYVDVCVY